MVVADAALLRDVRRLAIRDELLAMRLRGLLVVPQVAPVPHGHPPVAAPGRSPTARRTRRRP
jgi:hypothetical protein